MKKIFTLAFIMLLASCDNNNTDALQGIWETKLCEVAPSSLGPHEGKYGKGIYEFTENNTIKSTIQFYSGASCDEKTETLETSGNDQLLIFIDSGATTLEEGISGHGFSITYPVPDQPSSFDGFYTLINGELCFSDIINFNVYSVRSSGAETVSIDFEKCLIQIQP
ncbi:MAG: hypothetical protein QM504_11880 [Pseudomonadota bacterium]